MREPSPEARWLRENWGGDALRRYDRQWIAVLGREVTDADRDIHRLLERNSRRHPLYAFVWFGAM